MRNLSLSLALVLAACSRIESPDEPAKPISPRPVDAVIGESASSGATERGNARLVERDGDGVLHVVFFDGLGVRHARSEDDGESWTPPEVLGPGRNPSLAVDPAGRAHVVFASDGATAHDIVHQVFDGAWTTPEVVYHDALSIVSRPSISISADGTLHCVWQRAGNGSTPNSEIFHSVRAGAGAWAAPMNVSETEGASEYPAVFAGAGRAQIVWKDSGAVPSGDKKVLLREWIEGTGYGTTEDVSGTMGNGSSSTLDPTITLDLAGNLHLAWSDAGGDNREILHRVRKGGLWEAAVNVSRSSGSSRHPSISVDGSGRIHLLWVEELDGVRPEIVHATFEGGAWSAAEIAPAEPGMEAEFPNVPVATSDYVPFVWSAWDGESARVLFNRLVP